MADTNFIARDLAESNRIKAVWLNATNRRVYQETVSVQNDPYDAAGDGTTDDYASIILAQTAAVSYGAALLFPPGTYLVSSAPTFTVPVIFAPGAILKHGSLAVTFQKPIQADNETILDGTGTVSFLRQDGLMSRWFKYDGVDDAVAINKALAAARNSLNVPVFLGPGTAVHTTTINSLTDHGGVALVGSPYGTRRNGSGDVPSILQWTGGALPQILSTSPGTGHNSFVGITFDNQGSATHAIKTKGNREYIWGNSFIVTSGNRWSTAAIEFTNTNYDVVELNEFITAPALLFSGYGTPVRVLLNMFDVSGGSGTTYIISTGTPEHLDISMNTFNMQAGCLEIFQSTGAALQSGAVTFFKNEFDGNNIAGALRIGRFVNINQVVLLCNTIEGFGAGTNVNLIQTTTTPNTLVDGNVCATLPGSLVKTMDTVSRVYPRYNRFNSNNTDGVIEATSQSALLVSVIPAANTYIQGNLGAADAETTFLLDFTANTVAALAVATAISSTTGKMEVGQFFWIVFKNTSGGNLTNVTWGAEFKLAGGAFTLPVTGSNKGILFQWNGTQAGERARGSADVAN
jgi:hypothetical protein